MDRLFVATGSISAFIAIALGAFGAHALKSRLSTELLETFEVGVRYQMYHALALFAVAWCYNTWPSTLVKSAGWLFVVGTIIFSGSLYLFSLTNTRWLGAITPIGGLAFLIGWFCLAWGVLKASAN